MVDVLMLDQACLDRQTDRQTDRLQAKHHRVSIGFYIYNPKPEKGRKLRKGE
jgi:hypothetical protein